MPERSLFILLADDDPEDLEIFQEIILSVKPGTRIHAVKDGENLVSYLESCQNNELPDMIILDYNMPMVKGGALLAELSGNRRYKLVPKFVLSTSDSATYKEECLAKGAKAYFVKPGNLQELESMISDMISMAV